MSFRKFDGKNIEASSKTLFDERGKYSNEAVPFEINNRFPGVFRNFWFIENMYYGRIDRSHKFMILKEEKLATVDGADSKTIYMVDFAAQALSDFIREHKRAVTASKIQKNDEFLSELNPQRAHEPLLTSYDLHMNRLRDAVHTKMIQSTAEVTNFDEFIKFFVRETGQSGEPQPLTLTGFVSSRLCSPMTTGLFVNLVDLDPGDDKPKISSIIDRPNFQFVVDNALTHGFMIDYNDPTRLCANLGSLEMERYMQAYGTNSQSVFNDYYDTIYDIDHVYLMRYMKKFYNRFVRLRPNIRKEQTVNKKINKVFRYVEKRKILTDFELENRYGVDYRIELYATLRNRESGNRYSQALQDKIISNAKLYNKTSGVSRSLEYIDYQFVGLLSDPGAYNGFTAKKDIKASGQKTSGQDMEDLLRRSVAESRDTLY